MVITKLDGFISLRS